MITRRELFKMLAGRAIVKRLAPVMPAPEPMKAVIGQWADYLSMDWDVGSGFIDKSITIHPQVAADLREEGFEL